VRYHAYGESDRSQRSRHTQLPGLLHGQERELFGDQAYWKEDDRKFLETRGVCFRVDRRAAFQRVPANDQPSALADPGARRTTPFA
jgi:hypothetical protein